MRVKSPTYYSLLLLALTWLLQSTISYAQDEELSFKTIKAADGIYMLAPATGFTGGNIGVFIGDDAAVMIDNGVSSALELLHAEIEKLTEKPVDYLINTHIHGDHTGNNTEFGADGALIISHHNLRKALVEKGVQGNDGYTAAPTASLPVITFSDQMTLNVNGDAAKIIHLDNAHTDGDAVIYFQKANVIHAGDIFFNGRFPYIDYSNGGSLNGMIAALHAILEICDTQSKVIPGHGPLANKDDLRNNIAMLEDAKKIIANLITNGKTEEQIIAADALKKYASYSWGFINSERMIKQIITGLSKGK